MKDLILRRQLKQAIIDLKHDVKENNKSIKISLKYNDFGDAAHLDSVNFALEHAIWKIENVLKVGGLLIK